MTEIALLKQFYLKVASEQSKQWRKFGRVINIFDLSMEFKVDEEDKENWDKLVENGYVRAKQMSQYKTFYWVTEKGLAKIGKLKNHA